MFEIVPDKIGGAAVICYAVVNFSLPTISTSRVAYGMAICRYELDSAYYLFRCDDKWCEFADTIHETIDDAKDQAEYEFKGITDFWTCQ